jgi:hypothetical protein
MLRNVLTNCVITKTHPNIGSMIMREKIITSIQEAAWLEKGSWKEISKREHPLVRIFFLFHLHNWKFKNFRCVFTNSYSLIRVLVRKKALSSLLCTLSNFEGSQSFNLQISLVVIFNQIDNLGKWNWILAKTFKSEALNFSIPRLS